MCEGCGTVFGECVVVVEHVLLYLVNLWNKLCNDVWNMVIDEHI